MPAAGRVTELRGSIEAPRRVRPLALPADRMSRLFRGDALPFIFLAAFCGLLIALTWNTWGDLSMDTGYDLLAGSRTNHGEYPYLDFEYFYGPAAPFLLAEVFDVFGDGLQQAIALGMAIALAIVAGTYLLARELAGRLGGTLAAALVATAAFSNANNSFVLPHTLSAPLAVAFSLAALLAVAVVARGGRARWLVLAGVFAGGVTLTRPEYALAVVVALATWWVLDALDSRDRRRALERAALVAVPLFAIPAAAYGLALTRVPLSDLVTANLYPVDYIREAGSVVLRAHAPLTVGSFVELGGRLLLYAAGVTALVGAGIAIARGGRLRTAVIALLAGSVAVFLAVLAAKPETVRYYLEFAYAWIPAAAWLSVGVLLWRFRHRSGRWGTRAQVELLAVLFLAVVATKSYASFLPQPNPAHPPDTPYMLPFAAAFLAWLHLDVLARGRPTVRVLGACWLGVLVVASAALVIGDARDESVTVRSEHGQLAALPADGPAYQAALDLIDRETRPNEPILLAPQMTALYVMADRRNPLRQLSLLPGMHADSDAELEAIATLERSGLRLAITDRAAQTTYEHGAFGRTFDRRLARWLRSNFRRTAVLRGNQPNPRVLDVWQRSAP
jgi:4-amino-4-deoxy-L-arabinose transferase-like glycosyltransferase